MKEVGGLTTFILCGYLIFLFFEGRSEIIKTETMRSVCEKENNVHECVLIAIEKEEQ